MTATGAHEAFEHLVTDLDYPMLVVTAASGGQRGGCLVGFATQSSINPPRLLVCLSRRNHTYRVATSASVLVVHFLAAADVELARLFGEQTGDHADKFTRCEWDPGPAGTPVLRGCRGWVAGSVLQRFRLGDHDGFLLDIVDGEARRPDQTPLGFSGLPSMTPGHDA